MPGFLSERKVALRKQLLQARREMPGPMRARAESLISATLAARAAADQWKTVAVFLPWRGEPDLVATWKAWDGQGLHLALPVVVSQQAPLVMHAWRPGEPLIHDAMGMEVPARTAALVCDTWLIPCVGIDPAGARLGAGKGFYDRTVSDLRGERPRLVGISFECGRSAEYFGEPHDLRLDACVTEEGWHTFLTRV